MQRNDRESNSVKNDIYGRYDRGTHKILPMSYNFISLIFFFIAILIRARRKKNAMHTPHNRPTIDLEKLAKSVNISIAMQMIVIALKRPITSQFIPRRIEKP